MWKDNHKEEWNDHIVYQLQCELGAMRKFGSLCRRRMKEKLAKLLILFSKASSSHRANIVARPAAGDQESCETTRHLRYRDQTFS
jgi:hypothetical protein